MLPARRNGPPHLRPVVADILAGQTGTHIEVSLQKRRENEHATVTRAEENCSTMIILFLISFPRVLNWGPFDLSQ